MSAHLKLTIACAAAALVLSGSLASAKRPASVHQRGPVAKHAVSKTVCGAPAELVRMDHSLSRVAQKILDKQAITIVAIGSSSTFGEGASSPGMSYPSRLAVELRTLYPHSPVTVLNRGVNGETTMDMLARFDRDVFAAKPDLVIWQVGSNSVLSGLPVGPAGDLIREGLDRLKAAGTDVIIVDPQYAPAIINNGPDAMVAMIDATAREARVSVFHRFAVMRHWRVAQNIPFRTFVSEDELHMNDWSYGCIAKLLAAAISDVIIRPTVTANTP